MTKKEVLEIRKQFTITNCTISKICGCYVDEEGTIWWVQCFNATDTDLVNPTYRNPLL